MHVRYQMKCLLKVIPRSPQGIYIHMDFNTAYFSRRKEIRMQSLTFPWVKMRKLVLFHLAFTQRVEKVKCLVFAQKSKPISWMVHSQEA